MCGGVTCRFVAGSVWVIDSRKGFTPTSLFDQVSKLKCGSCTLVQYHSIHVHPPLRLRLCPNHKIFFYLWPRTTVYMQVRTLLTMNVTLWPFQILETIHVHIYKLMLVHTSTSSRLWLSVLGNWYTSTVPTPIRTEHIATVMQCTGQVSSKVKYICRACSANRGS